MRILIVSPDPLARSGLAALLAGRTDVAVAGGIAPGAVAPGAADAILFEVGSGARDSLRQLAAGLPVAALVADEAQAAEALAAGARAVVFRDASADRLAAALLAVREGLLALDGAAAAWVRPSVAAPSGDEPLTRREVEVLALLAEGLGNKAIAQRLGIAERTAKFHVESILAKLGAQSRSEAIVLAARRGLVTL